MNGKPLVMRLCKNDLIAIEKNNIRYIMRVAGIGKNLTLAEHNEANTDGRNRDKDDAFTYKYPGTITLYKLKARRVFVDLLGNVLDPGFRP